jgi:orotidine-5'-phosphate decarboxylase
MVQAARVEILPSSDSTGFVAVARGAPNGKDVNVVGRGTTQKEADANAFEQLNASGATKAQKIVYRYHSYGADAH